MGKIEEELHEWWAKKRSEIESRLSEFKLVGKSGEKRIFEELCFCLLTPQSSALAADKAIRHLIHTRLLYEGTPEQITPIISGAGIRFGDNKGRYIVQAREKLIGEGAILSLPNLLVDHGKLAPRSHPQAPGGGRGGIAPHSPAIPPNRSTPAAARLRAASRWKPSPPRNRPVPAQ